MPTDSTSDQPSQKGSKKIDDLKVIKGIGKALEQWLRETYKVETYADLVALSAQKIRSRAKQGGIVLSLSEVEQILAQAKELADAPQPLVPESGKPAKVKAKEIPAAPEEENEWKEFASFMVYFEHKVVAGKEEKRTTIERRTAIHHMETSEQASWSGIEAGQACQWMLERLGEKADIVLEEEAPGIETPSPAELPVPHSVSLEITGIQTIQPPSSDQPQDLFMQNHAFNGYVRGGEPLSFAVKFRLSGLGASEATKRHDEFSVVFKMEDLFTSAVTQLGVSKPDFLKEGQLSYTAWLSPITLSRGVYRLQIVAAVRDAQSLWSSIDVPLFQVA